MRLKRLKQKWLEYFSGTRKLGNILKGQRCKTRAKILLKARRKAEECMGILTAVFRGMDSVARNPEFADAQLAKILVSDQAERFLETYNRTRWRVVSYIKQKEEKEKRISRKLRREIMPLRDLTKKGKENIGNRI